MERDQTIDYLKGLLIILVTTGHVLQFVILPHGAQWSDPFFQAIYSFHMPLFMGLSGYLCHPAIMRSRLWDIMTGKARSYLVPIVAWAVLFKCCVFIALHPFPLGQLPLETAHEALGTLWFLWALLASIILTAALKYTGRFFWVAYSLSLVAVLLLPDTGNLVMFKFTYPFFQVGFLVAARRSEAARFMHCRPLVYTTFVAALVCYFLWNADTFIYSSGMSLGHGNWHHVALRFASGIFGSICVLAISTRVYAFLPQRLKVALQALGRDSIYIYILQTYAFVFVDRLASNTHFSGSVLSYMMALLIGTWAAGVCWLLGRLMVMNPIVASLLFGRSKRRLPRREERTVPSGTGAHDGKANLTTPFNVLRSLG